MGAGEGGGKKSMSCKLLTPVLASGRKRRRVVAGFWLSFPQRGNNKGKGKRRDEPSIPSPEQTKEKGEAKYQLVRQHFHYRGCEEKGRRSPVYRSFLHQGVTPSQIITRHTVRERRPLEEKKEKE